MALAELAPDKDMRTPKEWSYDELKDFCWTEAKLNYPNLVSNMNFEIRSTIFNLDQDIKENKIEAANEEQLLNALHERLENLNDSPKAHNG